MVGQKVMMYKSFLSLNLIFNCSNNTQDYETQRYY